MARANYEERLEAKRERFQALSEKNQAESNQRFDKVTRVSNAMAGTPILIGHHSEKRHRAALKRQDNDVRKGVEASDKADYYKGRAETVGTTGISSDDPEAVTKLKQKIANLEANQEKSKAINKVIRKHKGNGYHQESALIDLGYSQELASKLLELDFAGRIGIPAYEITNNGANIRRLKQRLATLIHEEATEEAEPVTIGNCTIVEDKDENRIFLEFPGKPSVEIRTLIKQAGFKWNRTRVAWSRHLNNAGRYAAKDVAEAIEKASLTPPGERQLEREIT